MARALVRYSNLPTTWLHILIQLHRIILRISPPALPSQNRLFLSTLLRCRLCRLCRRRDYAVARFRKKMNYLFVRPPPKRRAEVNAIEFALPPRNLHTCTHTCTHSPPRGEERTQDRSLALIADCGGGRETEEEGGQNKASSSALPRLL